MKSVLKPVHFPRPLESIERILSRYYPQLVEWGRILARGEDSAAEETVQDLCLHLTVARPDLSRVQNLDNYLFMCLRNMYVSNLARVSRERLRVLHIEDYDAVGRFTDSGSLNAVDVQNDLIRIGDHVLSRKYTAKSASQFILHFFFGYRRNDVALLARLPVSAVYNSLKELRAELREYLSANEKLRLIPRGAAPARESLRTAIPSDLLLKQLRATILDADPQCCVAENELVEAYKQPEASPVSCRELAHLAGCERCLNILDRALRLDDRDGPLDGIDPELEHTPKRDRTKGFDATMRLVRKRRQQILERRPTLLAIALDGRVVAFHAVESAHNSLSSRVDSTSTVHFIEVFNEFGDRLAHIPLDPESATTPPLELSQQIPLSDDRRLRLDVRLDGLGIHAEVDYLDPALAPVHEIDDSRRPEKSLPRFGVSFRWPARFRLVSWAPLSFASLLLACFLGIAGYRYMHPAWEDVLARARAVAPLPMKTEALHQMLRVEQTMGPQKELILGSVDIWRSSDNHVVRRLYDAQQQLLATSIESEDGTNSIRLEDDARFTPGDRQLIETGAWRSDVSIAAFSHRQETGTEVSRHRDGFELTQNENGRVGVLSRTLVLDGGYHIQAERIRYQTREGVREIRLVQNLLRRVPIRDVPPSIFPESGKMTGPMIDHERNAPSELRGDAPADGGSENLEVALLFELFRQNADVGQPLEVSPIAAGRVRITGTLANAQLLATIRERVAALPDANRVDFQIYSARDAASVVRRGKTVRQQLVGSTDEAPAAGLVRDTLLARGLKGEALQNAEREFRASALAHAQTALQHAYALDRLGTILRRNGQSPLLPDARVKWAQMVQRHSTIAATELEVLRLQLDSISADIATIPPVSSHGIADANAFTRSSSELRVRAQSVNEEVVKVFAGSAAELPPAQARASIVRLRDALPLPEADRMRSFAARLAIRNAPGQNDVGEVQQR